MIFVAVGAIIVLPIVALVTARANARNLREELASLSDKIRDMESQIARLAGERDRSAPAPEKAAPIPGSPQPAPVAERVQPVERMPVSVSPPPAVVAYTAPPISAVPVAPPVEPTPQFAHMPSVDAKPLFETRETAAQKIASEETADGPSTASKTFSLEERLGTNWLNKLGIAILVVGLAFFLAYKLQTMGPAGKVLCGYVISAALLAGGVWLERKATYRIFARAGIGGGWALAFFTTFAMHHLDATRVLHSVVADLVLMLLVAAGMVAHSLRYRSQTVTGLAFLLGYLTLLASHLQAADGTVVFSLSASAILAVALVAVTTLRHYAVLEIAGLCAVYITHFVWLTQVLPGDHAAFTEFWSSTALILLYWLIFRLAYVLRTPLDRNEENLSSLAAILNSGGVLGLLKYQSAHPEWAFWALATLGAIEMGLAFTVRKRRRQAFVVLSTIAVVLLVAAVPFRFHGVSWPVLWLVESQALALCGLRLGEPVFRRLGLLAGVVTGAVLAIVDVAPLILFRLDNPDPAHHASLTVALALAATLYWIHGELYPRRWPQIAETDIEAVALQVTSWLGLAAAAAALWTVLPAPWVVVGWLALVLLLGLFADGFKVVSLAMQSDALALAAVLGLYVWNLWSGTGWSDHRLPLGCSVALLYAGMRRRTGSFNYVPAVYSWLATLLLAFVAFDQASAVALGSVWAVLGIVFFEIGRFARKGFLRWQGFFLVALAFGRYLFADLPDTSGSFAALRQSFPAGRFSLTHSLLLEMLVLAVAGFWLAERTRSSEPGASPERIVGLIAGGLSTFSIAAWFGCQFPSDWVPVQGGAQWVSAIWAAMATSFLALSWLLRRRALLAQAIALALAAVLRSVLLDLSAVAGGDFWHEPLFHISLTSFLLLLALPFAFRLRKEEFLIASFSAFPEIAGYVLGYPEQWFFFSPFALMVIALADQLKAGHITIAWSVLGVAVFLFALVVGERSYRLAGLGLLLVSVVKILLMDVWALAPSDRYTTLIILGLALLAVSFLYTRFGAVIRRYL